MKGLEKIAKGISAVMYPLFVPAYGMILFCAAFSQTAELPWVYWLVVVGSTFFLTGLLPILLILYQVHRGDIEDIYIQKKEERTLAYIETICGFVCWWYLLNFIFHAPSWLGGVALGGSIAIALVAVINRWWKISAHLTGMGGLVGGVLVYSIHVGSACLWLPIGVILLSWLVMWARLYEDAHTPWQVVAGFGLGLSCTLITPLCYV